MFTNRGFVFRVTRQLTILGVAFVYFCVLFCVTLRITLRVLVCHGCVENLISVLNTISDIKICSLQL